MQKSVKVKRTHFPLLSACAMTIHKSQGGTYSYIVYAYDKNHNQKMVYVAITRVTDINNLFIVPANGQFIFYHSKQNKSCEEVRGQVNKMRYEKAIVTISSKINAKIENENGFALYSLNCVSLQEHCFDFDDSVIKNCVVLLLSETSMDDEKQINIPNFNLITQKKHKNKRNAGVAIYQNDTDKLNKLKCNSLQLVEQTNYAESSGIELPAPEDTGDICSAECFLKDGRKVHLVCTFISPGQKREKIEQFLMKKLLAYSTDWNTIVKNKNWSEAVNYYDCPLILCGDFNINFTDKNKKDTQKFLKFIDETFNLKIINDPAINTTMKGNHKRASTIDAVFARYVNDIQSNIFITYFSDHKPLVTYFPFVNSTSNLQQ